MTGSLIALIAMAWLVRSQYQWARWRCSVFCSTAVIPQTRAARADADAVLEQHRREAHPPIFG